MQVKNSEDYNRALDRLKGNDIGNITERVAKPQPESQVHITRKHGRAAARPWKNLVSAKQLRSIQEKNYTVDTVIDTVAADRTKGGWQWVPVDTEIEDTEHETKSVKELDHLLKNPNDEMTGKDLMKAINEDLELFSDAFIEIVFSDLINMDTGEVAGRVATELWPVPAESIDILPKNKTGQLPDPESGQPAYSQELDGQLVHEWLADEMLHIRANNHNQRLYGRPKMVSLLLLIATQMEAIKYNYKTFAGEKIPRQIVTIDTDVDDLLRMLDEAEEQLDKDPKAVEFLAGKSAQVIKLMESMRDMEFLGLVKYLERSIHARWRLPPVAVGISEAGGAGIVVGDTQINKYWDMIEEGDLQVSEAFTRWGAAEWGIENHEMQFIIKRPKKDLEEAQIEDIRIRNNTLKINEARAAHGLDTVDWGEDPFSPMGQQPAPALFSVNNSHGGEGEGMAVSSSPLPFSFPDYQKAISPVRQDHGDVIQLSPQEEKQTIEYAGRMVGAYLDMRRELLALTKQDNIILNPPQPDAKKAEGIVKETLLADALRIAEKYNGIMDEISKEQLLEAYLDGKSGAALELETSMQFEKEDISLLRDLQTAWASSSIRTFTAEKVQVIEQSLKQVAASPDLYTFRTLVEEALGENLWKEQWKLDRIARSSLGRVSAHARGQQFRDATRSPDPGVKWTSAMDPPRARTSHMALHKKSREAPIKLSDALREKNAAPNCRCFITLAQELPKGVPKPEDLVGDIRAERKKANDRARRDYLGGAS